MVVVLLESAGANSDEEGPGEAMICHYNIQNKPARFKAYVFIFIFIITVCPRIARFSGKIYAKIEFQICQKYAKFQDPTKRVKSNVLLHIIVK